LVVERHAGTSIFPRATGVSTRTMEIFRTWGVHDLVRAGELPVSPLCSVSPTLRTAMPQGMPAGYPTDVRAVLAESPTLPACVRQDHIEPVLLDHLRQLGADVRFGVELAKLTDRPDGVHAILRDRTTGVHERVGARFVVGADGPRGDVRRALGIGLTPLGTIGEFVNVIFRADLDPVVGDRRYGLYIIENPDAGGVLVPVGGGRWCYARQWFPEQGESADQLTAERCVELVRAAVGVPNLDLQLLARLPFTMAADLADTFRSGHGFLVGDAAHRMTPVGGLGMNTAIAAGHNLGWKLAWLARGWAGEDLLSSYEEERRSIGESRARRSLQRGGPPGPDPLGEDVGMRYASSVVASDGGERASHAWVTVEGRRCSTLDLFDGRLTLLAGRDAAVWRAAADRIAGPPLAVVDVGRDDAVLVRPDGHVGWRPATADRPEEQLRAGLDLALGGGGASGQRAA
ncbi:MAG: FAD-dependent monooxygenase, partial [Pseudonocardia sp.]|nr:FAD-dependent monooxygenase [Pseudonocardia sp.]